MNPRTVEDYLHRHPIPMATTLRHSMVLSYAVPTPILRPLCPPGVVLDTYGEFGFVAIAAVRAQKLRPRGVPEYFGRDFMLTGYRIFVRFRDHEGHLKRGLHVVRSDTDSRLMCLGGNMLTRYRYERATIQQHMSAAGELHLAIAARDGTALELRADTANEGSLPHGSPFIGTSDQRRYCGPLPWTIDYEAASNSLICVRGRRGVWNPRLVDVDVAQCTFFDRPEFRNCVPRLAAAFYVDNVAYSWDRGLVHHISGSDAETARQDGEPAGDG